MFISAAKASEAASVLGVELTSLTPDNLSRAYRTKTKECHPDYHGSNQLDMWAKVSWAKEVLVRWLENQSQQGQSGPGADSGTCRACGGGGRIRITSSGFGAGLTKMCVMCGGTGEVQAGEAFYGRSE